MSYLGDFPLAATIRHYFNTNAVAGESITRATDGTISVYKDGELTQSVAGVTSSEDFDSLTGVHLVSVDTSADGTFYSAGSDFAVVLSGSTIDGKAINAHLFSFSINNRSALRPTVAGRALDVSAGGEAGLDWANVGSPTTAVGLSGTTVKTATDVEADTADIQTRIPAALTAGRINANVGSMEAAVLTAAAVATGAIDADAVAADAVTEIQSGLATSAALATVQADTDNIQTRLPAALVSGRMDVSVGAMAADVVTAAAVATGAIDADALAADALTAAKVAADVGAEIAAAVRTELAVELALIDAAISSRLAAAGYTAPDNATITAIAGFVDTEIADIQARLPAALDGGRMNSIVNAMAADVITASALSAGAVDEILDDTIGDSTITVRQALRVLVSGMAGKLSGAATTTVTIRNLADSANVIVATVDADGNRSAVTVTP